MSSPDHERAEKIAHSAWLREYEITAKGHECLARAYLVSRAELASANELTASQFARLCGFAARVAELEAALADLWDADAFGPHPLITPTSEDPTDG